MLFLVVLATKIEDVCGCACVDVCGRVDGKGVWVEVLFVLCRTAKMLCHSSKLVLKSPPNEDILLCFHALSRSFGDEN